MRDRRRSCSPGAIQQPWCLVLQLYFLKFDRRIKKQTNKNRKNPTKTPQVVETKASVTKDVCCHTSGRHPQGKVFLGSGSAIAHQHSQHTDVFKKTPAPVGQTARGRWVLGHLSEQQMPSGKKSSYSK